MRSLRYSDAKGVFRGQLWCSIECAATGLRGRFRPYWEKNAHVMKSARFCIDGTPRGKFRTADEDGRALRFGILAMCMSHRTKSILRVSTKYRHMFDYNRAGFRFPSDR
jgi:hypothetical protein